MIAAYDFSLGAIFMCLGLLFGAQAIHSSQIFKVRLSDRAPFVTAALLIVGAGWAALGIIELGKAVWA